MNGPSRRAFLTVFTAAAIAGCLGSESPATDRSVTDGSGPPTRSDALPIPDDPDVLSDSIVYGGVSQDGIPSIDDPHFISADAAADWIDDGDPVFGVSRNGEDRAFPQRILVWHEIVNIDLGGEPLAITYCPLTGTAQGFERGETTFGVSGRLLNSNLIMFDRFSESYWPQMLATAIRGAYAGEGLREIPVTWTTWGRWRDHHPETAVLSKDTGYARDYSSDPYGSYNPLTGFYADESLMFEPYVAEEESEFPPKDVVLGARSAEGSIAVHKESLRAAGLLEGTVASITYVAVYDPALDTGYIYRNPRNLALEYDDGAVTMDAKTYDPADLPLTRVLRYDAFWFAWAGYYPDTTILR